MIVRMKRVAVLCTAASEHETLDALQALGVLHLDADNHAEAPALKESQATLDNAVKGGANRFSVYSSEMDYNDDEAFQLYTLLRKMLGNMEP